MSNQKDRTIEDSALPEVKFVVNRSTVPAEILTEDNININGMALKKESYYINYDFVSNYGN